MAARHAVPATYPVRDFAEAGGLMSYGTDTADAWRQTGVYTGRIDELERELQIAASQIGQFSTRVAGSRSVANRARADRHS
jgi:putative ABC transport system substrate-binding protein